MLDKGFIKYIKGHKDFAKIILILAIGLVLVFIGVGGGGDKEDSEGGISLEDQLSDLCSSVEGVGECRILIYYSDVGTRYESIKKAESVLVVCEGADSLEIRRELTEMLTSFLGIGSNRVRIERLSK